ncbi:MAG: hypothetical protein JXR66_07620 [Bacteroidales bacterium]|nr:hypothetical protein [Bacteroidales bacterium]
MKKESPFKFLDSYTREDSDIFFGRDREIEELHARVFESRIMVVYGTSGTGKSSLINCGLANRFDDSDWLPVNVRRRNDINRSLFETLEKFSVTKAPFEKASASADKGYNLEKLLRSLWLDHFKPLFLIFDQFEELFIFGSREERAELMRNVASVINSDLQCRFIFSMREEYLAGVTEFEKEIPSFLSNRIRIEKMTRQNAVQTIEGPCKVCGIEVEPGFAEALLTKLNPDSPDVELTWLQIYLDRIMKLERQDHGLTKDLLEKAGNVKDILGTFLEEQIACLDDPDKGMAILKSFVSVKGTKNQLTEDELTENSGTFGTDIGKDEVKDYLQKFIKLRILRDKDENGKYELRHDSLASKIYEDITLLEKELMEVRSFVENAFSSYEKRRQLLNEEDLNYIAPYEDKLFLSEKINRFIEDSRQALQRARRRRLNWAVSTVAIIFALLTFFTIWAQNEKRQAEEQRQIAEEQKDAAIRAREESDSAKQAALLSQMIAEEREKEAKEARDQSEIDRKSAEASREDALWEKNRAEEMSARAIEEARKAEEERKFAEEQKNIAQEAEERARRLNMLSKAQNLALISTSLDMNPEIMGLLAVQAFNFNISNGGQADDPVIYNALDKAWSVLDNSKHSVFPGAVNEIRSLSENDGGINGADLEGNIWFWDNEGNPRLVRMAEGHYIDFVSLGRNKILTAFENRKIVIEDITGNNQPVELTGSSGTVRTVSWNIEGGMVAAGTTDSLIVIWRTETKNGEALQVHKANSAVRALAFCDNERLASVQDDGSVMIWNLLDSSGEALPTTEDKILCIAHDPSRANLLAGAANGMVIIYNLESKLLAGRFASHTSGIDNITFNDDFSLLATSAWDKVIRIHNYEEFFDNHSYVKGVINIANPGSRARTLLFTRDNRLFAGMSDKTIRLWITSPSKLSSLICSILKRDMSTVEWSNYVGSDIPYEKTCGNIPSQENL